MILIKEILVFLILYGTFKSNVKALLVKSLTKFPIPMNTAFQLQIVPEYDEGKLTNFIRNVMVIQIIDGSGSIKQKEIFNCGIQDTIDRELQGLFMNILKWEVNKSSNAIDISIIFKLGSNSCILEIYFISASSKQTRMEIMKDLNLAKRIYRSIIILFSSSKLNFTVQSNSSNNGEFKIGDIIVASCRAYDGIPKEIPKFENYQNLSIIEHLFSIETNERTIKFRVRKADHLIKLHCLAGKALKTLIIKIFHNSTRLCDIECVNKRLLDLEYLINNIDKLSHRNKLFEQLKSQINKISKDNENLNKTIENKNNEIQQFKNEWKQQLEKQSQNYLSRTSDKRWLCKDFLYNGGIETKGPSGEIHEWIIKNFQNIQNEVTEIYSPPFYSFHFGYNMLLRMDPKGNGAAKNSYMSLYFYILPGEFDAHLSWPMKHEIKLSMKWQTSGYLYHVQTLSYFIVVEFKEYFLKPPCKGNNGLGLSNFISLKTLNEFLFNDSIVVSCEVIKRY